MFKQWIEKHLKLSRVFLLVLATLNTWIASAIFLDYPILALANGAMAIVIVVGVLLLWGASEPK